MTKQLSFIKLKLRKHIFLLALVILSATAVAQELTITGKVVEEKNGLSIPGASIVIMGTSTGTITDFDGNYTLKVNKGDQLQFSFMGMLSQTVIVSDASVYNIQLKEDQVGLTEVIVTGYSSQRKADLTGAVEVVKLESIKNVSLSSGNPMQALQGRIPGLYIEKTGDPSGTNSRILIRGINTLGDNNPLYIIDGVPTKRPEVFQNLSPGSIVSVQVLKDASASSIYGSRASNGVVIVTTKNGANQDGKIKVQFNSNIAMQSEKYQRYKMANAVDRGKALWQASVNDRQNPADGYGEIYNFDWNGDFDNPVLNKVSVQPFVGGNPNVPSGDTDWQDEIYETGYVHNNEITISGGTETSSALLSLGYMKNTGMLKYTNYDRFTARLNAQTSMFEQRFRIGMNSQVVTSNETLAATDLGSARTPGLAVSLAPTIPLYTTSGEFAGPIGSGYSDRNNPLHMQYINRWDNTNRNYLFANVYAEIEPIKKLIFRSNVGIDYSTVKDKDIEQSFEEGFIARDVNNLTVYNSDFISTTWSNTLRYNLDLGRSKFGFLLGVESISDNFSDLTGYKEGFSVQTEDYFVLSAGTANGNSLGNSTSSRLFSQFGKIDYNFADKYLASLTLRRDGSSRFGKENRYGYFPAVTGGWRISEEPFLKNNDKLSNLKVRVGWGQVGNQDIGDFASFGLFEPRYGARASEVNGISHVDFFDQFWNIGSAYDLNGANSGNLPSGFVSVQASNARLRWESMDELNFGVDFGFLDSKIIGSFDYFTRTISDILIQPPVASAVGEGQVQWLNGATKKNSGWELGLSYYAKKKNDFSYNVTLNMSQFVDKITELPEEVRTAYPGNAEKTILGHSELSVFGYITDGLFKNQAEVDAHADQPGKGVGRIRYKDLNDDNVIDALDQDFIGTLLPKLEYGLKVELEYKAFDLSLFGSGVAGKTGYDPYTYVNDFVRGRDNVGPGVFKAWTKDNPNSTVPALTLADANNESRTSDYYFVNASYFKVRNLQLGYTFPETITNKIKIESLRLYLMADNLLIIKTSDFQGTDPERTNWDNIPIPRTFSFGINVTL